MRAWFYARRPERRALVGVVLRPVLFGDGCGWSALWVEVGLFFWEWHFCLFRWRHPYLPGFYERVPSFSEVMGRKRPEEDEP